MIEVDIQLKLGTFALEAKFCSEAPVTALFGRSGAGKSTIVKAIGGLIRPDTGRIVVGGAVMFESGTAIDMPARTRRIGHVFQDARLFPHMTVAQNLAYGGRFAAQKPSSETFDEVVKLLDIGPLLARRPAGLSGGETQRVAIGRALLMSPVALMMDEPLASLDSHRKAEILPYLDRLTAETDIPVLFVSHTLEEVARLASSLVLIDNGQVITSGPVEDILARADLADLTGVAEIGTILTATVGSTDEAYDLTALQIAGQTMTVPRLDMASGRKVRIVVGANDVVLAIKAPHGLSTQNVLNGTIDSVEQTNGASAEVRVDIGGVVLKSKVTRRSIDALELVPGRDIFALVKSVAIARA